MSTRESIVVATLLAGVVVLAAETGAGPDSVKPPVRLPLTAARLAGMSRFVHSDTVAAVVTFKSNQAVGFCIKDGKATTEKISGPATALTSNLSDGKEHISINGSFRVEKAIHLAWDHTGNLAVDVPVRTNWGGDAAYQRVNSLLNLHPTTHEVTVLALLPAGTRSFADAYFFGPLTDKDIAPVTEYVQLLVKEPFSKMSSQTAQDLLKSPNPWKAWLGVAKLQSEGNLTLEHLTQAGSTLPATSAREIVVESLLLTSADKTLRPRLTPALNQLCFSTTPAHALAFVTAINDLMKAGSYNIRELVDLPNLQAAARKYRQELGTDPKDRPLVAAVDALISSGFN